MPESNGSDNTRQRLEQLEQMDKLLLRAQVLQQDAIETLERSIKRHDEWQARHEEALTKLETRIDNLVGAIADLIRRIPPGNLTASA